MRKTYTTCLISMFIGLILILAQHKDLSDSKISAATAITKVPFDYSIKEIVIQAHINGTGPFNLMIDTGIYPSILSTDVAKELGLDLGKSPGNILGVSGTTNNPYFPININEVQVRGYKSQNLEAIAVNIDQFSSDSLKIHGILGHSFLKTLITRIDYKNKQLEFLDRLSEEMFKGKEKSKDYYSLPLNLEGGKIPRLDELVVNGEKISAWLDTGSNTTLTLSAGTANRLLLKESPYKNIKVSASGTRGDIQVKTAEAKSVQLGPFIQDSIMVIVFDSGGKNLLGNPFFENYILTLDYLNKKIYIERSFKNLQPKVNPPSTQ